VPENENNMATIKSDEWPYILDLFDQCLGLSEQQQLKKLAETNLSKSAQTMIERMLRNHNIPFILNRTIDPLVEQLLGEEAIKEYINPAEIIGRDFGPWRAVEPLGSGGMGQVFTAERADGQYEKQVALKVIKSGHYSELSKQRFLEEMRTLAQFEHPHIAHLIDGGTSEDDIIYFIMERVKGDSIIDYAEKHKLSLVTRIQLLFQAIDAVEYAHQNLVIHGDIKPANLLVNEAGQIKLVDFGIARPVDTADKDVYLPQFTPSHSSPEQAQGKALSTASDVFGLCAVLYELCTGTAPRKQSAITRKANHTTSLNTPISPVLQRSKKQNKIINQSARQQHNTEDGQA
jgi:serine/threonine protein kinase